MLSLVIKYEVLLRPIRDVRVRISQELGWEMNSRHIHIISAFMAVCMALAAQTPQGGDVREYSANDLFALKSMLEAQIETDFVEGSNAKNDGSFEFLIGEWDLVRTSFDENGNVASQTKGSVVARYTFEGRVIQEDFYNYRSDGTAYRGGIALYTYSPSSKLWHVAAADVSTGATSYKPTWANGEVQYESTVRLPDREVYTKSRIFNISLDTTEWEQKVSLDGLEWFSNYHIINHRKK
jgi:hypothetical protein